jgi:hypothetical protein
MERSGHGSIRGLVASLDPVQAQTPHFKAAGEEGFECEVLRKVQSFWSSRTSTFDKVEVRVEMGWYMNDV